MLSATLGTLAMLPVPSLRSTPAPSAIGASKNVETPTPIDSGAIELHYPWGDANVAFHG
jgi:hypothetical protein